MEKENKTQRTIQYEKYLYNNDIHVPEWYQYALNIFYSNISTTFSNNNFTGILRFHDNNVRHHSHQAYSFINP